MQLGNPIKYAAELTGGPEAALAVIMSLTLAMFYALAYLWLLSKTSPQLKHIYFIITGCSLLWINYGHELIYVVASIVVTHMIMKALGPTPLQCGVNFAFNMCYLLVAYRIYETDDYDINWTTAQCVMCLRNIAIGFDYMDSTSKGSKDKKGNDVLSSDQMHNYIDQLPDMLEMFSYSLFFPAVLIGPQITLRHFRDFVRDHVPGTGDRPTRRYHVLPGWRSYFMGIAFLVAFQVLEPFVPQSYYLSKEFLEEISLPERLLFMWKRHFIFFYRYISCWLMSEGACIITGVAYMGQHKDKTPHWGLHNIRPWQFHFTLTLAGIIQSFNINTNYWVMRIVFKRLRWLNNKNLSQFGALMFLAIWHGFHTAYFYAFGLEFFTMVAERNAMIWGAGIIDWAWSPSCPKPVFYALCFAQWLLRTFMLANGVLAFDLFKFSDGYNVQKSMYFIPHLLIVFMIFLPFVCLKIKSEFGTLGLRVSQEIFYTNLFNDVAIALIFSQILPKPMKKPKAVDAAKKAE